MNFEHELSPLISFSKGLFHIEGDYSGSWDDGEINSDIESFSRPFPKNIKEKFEELLEVVISETTGYRWEEGGYGDFTIWYDGKLHWKIDHNERYVTERELKFNSDNDEP